MGAKIISEKKQRRIWAKAAKKLAGKDIDKFLDDYEKRFTSLQRLFWFSFSANFMLYLYILYLQGYLTFHP